MIELIIIILAVAGAWWLANSRDGAERWFRRLDLGRRGITGLFWIAVAVVFIGTGMLGFMLAGALIIGYIALYVFYENPHEEVKQWTP